MAVCNCTWFILYIRLSRTFTLDFAVDLMQESFTLQNRHFLKGILIYCRVEIGLTIKNFLQIEFIWKQLKSSSWRHHFNSTKSSKESIFSSSITLPHKLLVPVNTKQKIHSINYYNITHCNPHYLLQLFFSFYFSPLK